MRLGASQRRKTTRLPTHASGQPTRWPAHVMPNTSGGKPSGGSPTWWPTHVGAPATLGRRPRWQLDQPDCIVPSAFAAAAAAAVAAALAAPTSTATAAAAASAASSGGNGRECEEEAVRDPERPTHLRGRRDGVLAALGLGLVSVWGGKSTFTRWPAPHMGRRLQPPTAEIEATATTARASVEGGFGALGPTRLIPVHRGPRTRRPPPSRRGAAAARGRRRDREPPDPPAPSPSPRDPPGHCPRRKRRLAPAWSRALTSHVAC